MERRKFIRSCCYTVAGGAVLASTLSSCGSIYYAKYEVKDEKFIIARSEFVEIKNEKLKKRKFVVLKGAPNVAPICVYRIEKNTFQASLMVCTHQGCELNVAAGIYTCPCHGSEFSNMGKVLEGPAETDLTTYKTEVDDENIYVHLA